MCLPRAPFFPPPQINQADIQRPSDAYRQITAQRQQAGQQKYPQRQRGPEAEGPFRQCLGRIQRGRPEPLRRSGECGVVIRLQDEMADAVGEQIQGDDGERVGVERGEQGDRQIAAKDQHADEGAEHLKRAGNQAAEQADGDSGGNAVAMQAPQRGCVQDAAEQTEPAIVLDVFGIGQIFADEFSWHDSRDR